ASSAHIGVVDKIFTRIGASDDLSAGQSTFMVEMLEVANILHNATAKSLLILDEIGRGTSTFDGLAIAWSVLEYITDKKLLGAKALFATHYHELTELEGRLSGVKNYCITVCEDGEDIIFLRKIVRGGADNSYGVQVARLAGLPQKVIKRAGVILKQLNDADIAKKTKKLAKQAEELSQENAKQMDMFTLKENVILDEISKIDVMALTPIEAIQTLFDLQKKAKGL
ncbi:MAG: DNA mismatch repair protein MutS, partial [Firmicutes bacterium]|nr:DNA mismatch repair protein MutS [Bacillota bacterium]